MLGDHNIPITTNTNSSRAKLNAAKNLYTIKLHCSFTKSIQQKLVDAVINHCLYSGIELEAVRNLLKEKYCEQCYSLTWFLCNQLKFKKYQTTTTSDPKYDAKTTTPAQYGYKIYQSSTGASKYENKPTTPLQYGYGNDRHTTGSAKSNYKYANYLKRGEANKITSKMFIDLKSLRRKASTNHNHEKPYLDTTLVKGLSNVLKNQLYEGKRKVWNTEDKKIAEKVKYWMVKLIEKPTIISFERFINLLKTKYSNIDDIPDIIYESVIKCEAC